MRLSSTTRTLRAALGLGAVLTLGAPLSHAQGNDVGAGIATHGSGAATACISCHGAHGEGNAAAGFPRLAGLGDAYLESQLAAFADGKRQNPVMQPIAKALNDEQRKAVSRYFSQMKPPAGVAAPAKTELTPADSGAWLAERGRWKDDLPACVQCHGPGGTGVGATFPPLAGQPAAYISAQLHAFKSGARPGGPLNLMKVVASKLSDADITAVADHYAGQKASPSAEGGKK